MADPFRARDPFRVAHPYAKPHHVRKARKATGHFQRAFLFGGRKIGRHKGSIRHLGITGKPVKRRIEGRTMMADERRAKQLRTRRIMARAPGAFRGNVVDPRITLPRRIEREDA